MRSTRVDRKRNEPAQPAGFPERLALFVTSLHKQQAEALFAGLSPALEQRAQAFAAELKSSDSARRQARLAHEFGVRPDVMERLKELVLQTDGTLRSAVVAFLPPPLRAQFPQFPAPANDFPESVRALAARLVREASR